MVVCCQHWYRCCADSAVLYWVDVGCWQPGRWTWSVRPFLIRMFICSAKTRRASPTQESRSSIPGLSCGWLNLRGGRIWFSSSVIGQSWFDLDPQIHRWFVPNRTSSFTCVASHVDISLSPEPDQPHKSAPQAYFTIFVSLYVDIFITP